MNLKIENQFSVIKHEFVEIQIPASTTQTRLYFPELPNLRNVHLQNIEVTQAGVIPFSPSNTPLINNALFMNTFLTLVDYGGKEFVHQIPLTYLQYIVNPAATHWDNLLKRFCNQRVNWTKSYIEFSSNTNVAATLEVAIFSVFYADVKEVEARDRKINFNNQR